MTPTQPNDHESEATMWHPLASHRAADAKAEQLRSAAAWQRQARELRRSHAAARARAEHPALFLQPRAPSRPEAA